MGSNREWLRTWVNSKGSDLGTREKEIALDVAESAFRGQTGVGVAAKIGIEVAKKMRDY